MFLLWGALPFSRSSSLKLVAAWLQRVTDTTPVVNKSVKKIPHDRLHTEL